MDKINLKLLNYFITLLINYPRSRPGRTRLGGTGFSGPCQTTRTLRGTSTVRWDPPWTPRRSARCGNPSELPEMWYTEKRENRGVRVKFDAGRRHMIKIESAKIVTGVPISETNYILNIVPCLNSLFKVPWNTILIRATLHTHPLAPFLPFVGGAVARSVRKHSREIASCKPPNPLVQSKSSYRKKSLIFVVDVWIWRLLLNDCDFQLSQWPIWPIKLKFDLQVTFSVEVGVKDASKAHYAIHFPIFMPDHI